MRRWPWLVAVAALALGSAVPAQAAGYSTVALFDLNEPTGTTVLADTSGHHHTGTIGAHVVIGAGHGVHTYLAPQPAYDPARVDTLPVYPDLAPGARNLRVSMRLYSAQANGGHLVSWGQSPNPMVRIQLSYGRLACGFRGTRDFVQVLTPATRHYNDSAWHTLVCTKTAAGVALQVDGGPVLFKAGTVGAIVPRTGLSIAGKRDCTGAVGHDCDYYVGHLDWVRIEEEA